MKSPSKEQSAIKRLEKAFRAIAHSGGSYSIQDQAQNIHNVSIRVIDFKNYFNKRYPKRVAEILLNQIKFNGTLMKFEEYTENIEKLLSLTEQEKYKVCFDILDQDGDKRLSMSDILSFMQYVKETDIMNMNDLERIIK